MNTPKTKAGRPLVKIKKDKSVRARMNEQEYQVFQQTCRELGLSHSDLIRKRVLNRLKQDMINGKDLIRGLDQLGAGLNQAGNNINQLAKHANSLARIGVQDTSVTQQFMELMENYLNTQKSIELLLRKILKEMQGR